ncbi:hypothetical protein ACWGTI_29105 [Mesorhizobium sp. ArgA1]
MFDWNKSCAYDGQQKRRSSGHGILIRTCNGRKDYTGGANHIVALALLDDIPALAAAVRAKTGLGRNQAVMTNRARAA